MKKYYLTPVDNRKSFYGKAYVIVSNDGTETLYSYDTEICKKAIDGAITRIWPGWSATTGRHIKAFCGMNKRSFASCLLHSGPNITPPLMKVHYFSNIDQGRPFQTLDQIQPSYSVKKFIKRKRRTT